MVGGRQGRSYDATNRRAQALRTRERILDRARELFVSEGFAHTSMAAVAAAAEVSVPTVFTAFGSKVNLLKEAAETLMAGDARPVPMAERPELEHVRAGVSADDVLDRFAALVARRAAEVHGIYAVIYRSRDGHREVAEMADQLDAQRLRGAEALARVVLDRLDSTDEELLAEVRDGLWATMSLDWYEAFVVDRGWPVDRYRDWLREAMGIPLRRRGL